MHNVQERIENILNVALRGVVIFYLTYLWWGASQLVPNTNSYQVNSYPIQTRTQVNSYPLPTRTYSTRTQVNSYPKT